MINTNIVKINSIKARNTATAPPAIIFPVNRFLYDNGIVKIFFNVSSTRSLSIMYPTINVIVAGKIRLKLFQITVPENCKVYYTWDSSDPSAASTEYTAPIPVPEGNNVLSVIAIDQNTGKCSDIYRSRFEFYMN